MILRNSAKCNGCGTEIVSGHVHDFVIHRCVVPGNYLRATDPREYYFCVDGGREYLKRNFKSPGDYRETSILVNRPACTMGVSHLGTLALATSSGSLGQS